MKSETTREKQIQSALINSRRDVFHLMRDECAMGHNESGKALEEAIAHLSFAIRVLEVVRPDERPRD